MRVLVLFFASGVASLVLETVFRRELTLHVGSSVTATSLTLATFLGGLALGAAIFGRLADRTPRPLTLYAKLELGAAITGGAAVALLSPSGLSSLAPLPATLLLLPPSIFMGGTLPAVTRYVMREGAGMLTSVATLYGVNTLGASLGAGLSGFFLFEALGISATGWAGAALAALVGVAALVIDRGSEPLPVASPPRSEAGSLAGDAARRVAIAVASIGGAVALGYEVVWTRLLVLPLRSYAYSFSLMLALFLLGLVVGAVLLARFGSRIADPLAALAMVQLSSAAYVAVSVLWIPAVLSPPSEGGGFAGLIVSALVAAGPVVLPPTILSGMALPLAVRVFAGGPHRPGNSVGAVYAANTFGSIAGALAAGLFLLPAVGASHALAILATVGAVAGAIAALAVFRRGVASWAAIAVVAGCALALVVPPRPFIAAFSRTGRSTGAAGDALYFREGATDTVAVVRRNYGFKDADAKSVIVNGIAMTATVKPVWRYMAAEGHLPALFAPAPSRGLVICVGTGITLGALASHDTVPSIDAVDLSESVLGALPVFDRENRAAYRDPKVHLVRADGRNVLARSEQRYGLITLEPPPPIVAGSVHLYTLDFYRVCKKRLEPGGVVAQWLPLHAQSLASAQATARTFLEAFPYAQLWLPSIRDAVLIGSDQPLRLDTARLANVYASPATRESLNAAYFETPEALLGTYLLDRDGIARWSAGADLITDDHPWIEFFRRYGRTMSDREIATLLQVPPGSLDGLLGSGADPALRSAVGDERRAHLLYVSAEIDKDQGRAREAALASRATRFGLYRMGCDEPQLAALAELAADPAGGANWRKQVAMCRALSAPAASP